VYLVFPHITLAHSGDQKAKLEKKEIDILNTPIYRLLKAFRLQQYAKVIE